MTTPTDAKETTSLSASPVVVTNEEEDEEQDPVLDTQWLQRKENKWHSLSGFPQFLELQLNSFVACMERFHTDQMRVAKSPWRHLRQKYPRHFIPKWFADEAHFEMLEKAIRNAKKGQWFQNMVSGIWHGLEWPRGYPTIELLESDRCEIQVVAKHRVSDWNKIKNGGFLETSWPLGKLAAQLKLAGNKPKIAPIRILVKAVESKGFSSDVVFSNIGLEMGTMDQKTFRPWTKKRNVYLGSNKEPSKSQASATCLSFPINAQKTYDHGTELVHLASTDILDQNADARFLLAVEWKTLLQSPYVTMDAKVAKIPIPGAYDSDVMGQTQSPLVPLLLNDIPRLVGVHDALEPIQEERLASIIRSDEKSATHWIQLPVGAFRSWAAMKQQRFDPEEHLLDLSDSKQLTLRFYPRNEFPDSYRDEELALDPDTTISVTLELVFYHVAMDMVDPHAATPTSPSTSQKVVVESDDLSSTLGS